MTARTVSVLACPFCHAPTVLYDGDLHPATCHRCGWYVEAWSQLRHAVVEDGQGGNTPGVVRELPLTQGGAP